MRSIRKDVAKCRKVNEFKQPQTEEIVLAADEPPYITEGPGKI